MSVPPRRLVLVLVVTGALMLLPGCTRARVGGRCRTTDWGDDGRSWVLQCRRGRWVRAFTKADLARLLSNLNSSTTSTTLAVTTTTAAPTFDGTSRDRAVPAFNRASIGGPWWFAVEDHAPNVADSEHLNLGIGTVVPGPTESFILINNSLYCGNETEIPCTDFTDRSAVHMSLIGDDGAEYPYSTAPGAQPDFLSAGTPDDVVGYPKRIHGWSSFVLPRPFTGSIVLRVSVSGSGHAPVYFQVGDCGTWCPGQQR